MNPRDETLQGTYEDKVRWATSLINDEKYTDARYVLRDLLNNHPDDYWCLHLQAFCERGVQNYGLAYNLWMKSLTQARKVQQERWEIYNNIGESLHFMWRHQEAIGYLNKALTINPIDPGIWNNLAVCYLYLADPENCEACCIKALEIQQNHVGAIDNLSVSQLFRRKWKAGWQNYEVSLGGMYRMKYDYNLSDENGNRLPKPTWWEGEPGGILVVAGEQGLGDEIMFASSIPDVQNKVDHVILECNPKLEGLFRRSFPGVDVHGSRNSLSPVFRKAPTKASSLASMQRFVRNDDEDFTGEQYLTACPVRRKQWEHEFSKSSAPLNVGIAWTGGAQLTGKSIRCIPLADWKPIFDTGCNFVSLEYTDSSLEILQSGLDCELYPWATLTQDYDDTAALVAELDLVISVTTSVVHLAGGLGVPTWCLVPQYPNWRFGPQPNNHLIWNKSVELIRQEKDETWKDVIGRVAVKLQETIG